MKKIRLKKTSRKKWKRIVKDLKSTGDGDFRFTHDDCGYCQVYRSPSDGSYRCGKCPLNSKKLCNCGEGKAFKAVVSWYHGNEDQQLALKQAKKMLRAIKKDLANG